MFVVDKRLFALGFWGGKSLSERRVIICGKGDCCVGVSEEVFC
jgi:hypothetical protein